ncbi:MAG: hypothetical protein M3083_04145 [Actinomycetota bacterium]|nr:hypothetical protein [Actinomycetota bacterium]
MAHTLMLAIAGGWVSGRWQSCSAWIVSGVVGGCSSDPVALIAEAFAGEGTTEFVVGTPVATVAVGGVDPGGADVGAAVLARLPLHAARTSMTTN